MDFNKLTTTEQAAAKAAKKQLISDKDATFAANTRSRNKLLQIAEKYGVDIQEIYDCIPYKTN